MCGVCFEVFDGLVPKSERCPFCSGDESAPNSFGGYRIDDDGRSRWAQPGEIIHGRAHM